MSDRERTHITHTAHRHLSLEDYHYIHFIQCNVRDPSHGGYCDWMIVVPCGGLLLWCYYMIIYYYYLSYDH